MFTRRVRDTLDLCQSRSAADWEQFEQEFAEQISANTNTRKQVLEEMRSEPSTTTAEEASTFPN